MLFTGGEQGYFTLTFQIILAFVSNTNEETKRTEDSDYDGKLIKFRIWLVIVPFKHMFDLFCIKNETIA